MSARVADKDVRVPAILLSTFAMKNSADAIYNSSKMGYVSLFAFSAFSGVIYYFSNPKPNHFYDYTFRVAGNMLNGSIAFTEKQPNWLNEFVPFEGFYYSVFPLGGVLTMIPFAALEAAGLIELMPAAFIAAMSASVICFFLLQIAHRYEVSTGRRFLTTLGVLFGTWMWTNLTMGGAWQLALGFAVIGELGAIYFTVYNRKPLLAGLFFALAFGNRTEVLLTAPMFMYLLIRPASGAIEKDKGDRIKDKADNPDFSLLDSKNPAAIDPDSVRRLFAFCSVPFVLGVATLLYNYVRFQSFTDFGYARIPGVLSEPWYNHGIFSVYYIPRQAWEMLLKAWEWKSAFPYLVPNGFSGSILWSSPFLLFAVRFGSRDRMLKYTSWLSITILTFILWTHGNSGGWQFGYRYAMVLLPWLFVILLESAPKNITILEWTAFIFSVAANAYATWLFHWSEYVKP
ncbi:MAG: hypothetical protein WKF92_07280 [Pyrinomonadaceae bacterium]